MDLYESRGDMLYLANEGGPDRGQHEEKEVAFLGEVPGLEDNLGLQHAVQPHIFEIVQGSHHPFILVDLGSQGLEHVSDVGSIVFVGLALDVLIAAHVVAEVTNAQGLLVDGIEVMSCLISDGCGQGFCMDKPDHASSEIFVWSVHMDLGILLLALLMKDCCTQVVSHGSVWKTR